MAKIKILDGGEMALGADRRSPLVGEGVDTIVFILEAKNIFEPR